MKRAAATARNASLIVAAAISGCAAPSPFDTPPGMQTPSASMSAPPANTLPAPTNPSSVLTPGGQSSGPTLTPPTVSSGSETYLPSTDGLQSPSAWNQPAKKGYLASSSAALAASFKQTKASVTSALTIQPKVIPASDPVRLDSKPENAGMVSADLHYHAARVFEANNSLEAAAGHYRDALTRSPNDPRLVLGYSRVMDRAGNFPEAEAGYRRAIALAPNDPTAYNDLGLCHNRQGKWDAAIENLQHAVQLDSANPLYRNNLAMILVDAGRAAEALPQLVAVHGEAAANYNLGYMLLDRNHTSEARQYFQTALQLNPQLQQARQMLDLMEPVRPAPLAVSAPTDTAPADTTSRLPAIDTPVIR